MGTSRIDLKDKDTVIFQSLSISLPVRKKGSFIVSKDSIAILLGTEDISKLDNVTPDYIYSKKSVASTLLLSIPDKAKPQWNLVIATESANGSVEPTVMITIVDQAASKSSIKSSKPVDGTLKDVILSEMDFVHVVESEKDSCVTCYRGSKEALLYLLQSWVFIGFTKPLQLFNVEDIESISYSSITRSTFSLNIKLKTTGEQFEFSMIDQDKFDTINYYKENSAWNDNSMSEALRAKQTAKPEFSNELQTAMSQTQSTSDVGTQENVDSAANGSANAASDDDEEEDVDYEGESSDSEGESSSEEDSDEEDGQEADKSDGQGAEDEDV